MRGTPFHVANAGRKLQTEEPGIGRLIPAELYGLDKPVTRSLVADSVGWR
jgi:hypothetical protein